MRFLRSFERQLDLLGIRSRSDHEIILQIAVMTIENQVDALVDAADTHAGVVRDIRERNSGAAPRKVVADTSCGLQAGHVAPPAAAVQFQSDNAMLGRGIREPRSR